MKLKKIKVAYFSMEFALDSSIPNYAGGLGVLASDIICSMADLGIKGVGISLLYHQSQDPQLKFKAEKSFQKINTQTEVYIQGRKVVLDIWKKDVRGKKGKTPIYFLSANNENNAPQDRNLTEKIYPGDAYTKLCQEIILGMGGVKALKKLGYKTENYHMNEGHSAPLIWELLKKPSSSSKKDNFEKTKEQVKNLCAFTTHTPVPAGHDYFDKSLILDILKDLNEDFFGEQKNNQKIGLTELALEFSKARNSVSQIHRKTCAGMFPEYHFLNITNGIYHPRWVSNSIEKILNEVSLNWKEKPEALKHSAKIIDNEDLLRAHQKEKSELIKWVNSSPDNFPIEKLQEEDYFEENILTIGFARRFVSYKRPDLIFENLRSLLKMCESSKKQYRLQFIFAGKCAPNDSYCNLTKEEIEDFADIFAGLPGRWAKKIKVAMIDIYNLDVAKKMVSGCDIWLNNPVPPKEASGTSGMKAALNGVLNLSIADGWWDEAYKQNPESGWIFGLKNQHPKNARDRDTQDNQELLEKLSQAIDLYYNSPYLWTEMMKSSISLLSRFNTHRVVKEYEDKMWDTDQFETS
ncbi:MAG: alpha-glucan family phosphorylase [Patescibacteria group bacterium]